MVKATGLVQLAALYGARSHKLQVTFAPLFMNRWRGWLPMALLEIEASFLISAPPSRVWQVLTDFSAFPAWNPFIRSISGPLREGARLSVQIMPPGKSSMRFRPTVLVSRPMKSFAGAALSSSLACSAVSTPSCFDPSR